MLTLTLLLPALHEWRLHLEAKPKRTIVATFSQPAPKSQAPADALPPLRKFSWQPPEAFPARVLTWQSPTDVPQWEVLRASAAAARFAYTALGVAHCTGIRLAALLLWPLMVFMRGLDAIAAAAEAAADAAAADAVRPCRVPAAVPTPQGRPVAVPVPVKALVADPRLSSAREEWLRRARKGVARGGGRKAQPRYLLLE